MILLSTKNYTHLSDQPTHALRVFMNVVVKPDNFVVPGAHAGTITLDRINAYYAFGNLDVSGAFVHNEHAAIVETMVDMGQYEATSDRALHQAACSNLLNAGVVPHPERPHESVPCPSKKHGDFKGCDLDAYFAFFDPRLAGTVV